MLEDNDILERLKHPERETERRRMSRNLFVRNILNSLFILVAIAAIVGILIVPETSPYLNWCYGLGLIAVLIKMVEVVLRMPGFNKIL
ncbi:MAG: hypothetical protein IKB97_07255 [Bacteroidaceae bacterium]|nr:hypothetical protein [Bacteroidaceae bacterium]MBR2863338.1 hypothetical protein [Bacteroidaceae bacterium]